jgi:hypothetical protein
MVRSSLFIDMRDQTSDNTMTSISQNAIKSGFFVILGRNSPEIEREFHHYLKKQSQFQTRPNECKVSYSKGL